MRKIYSNVNVIDCVREEALKGYGVLVEGERIAQIAPLEVLPRGGDVEWFDLGGSYLMPGLWDVHVHPDYPLHDMPVPEQVTLFGHQLKSALLDSGIIGMRCAGTHSFMDVAWKRAFDSGQHLGPRLFTVGYPLTTSAGHAISSGHVLELDGVDAFVRAVRQQIKGGVDQIKLIMSGGIMGPAWDRYQHTYYLDDELRAAFQVARQRDIKVMVHATNPQAVKTAIQLGAHSIEHGYILDDECIELMVTNRTWYVPTLSVSHLTPEQADTDWEKRWVRNRNLSQALCCRADSASILHTIAFRKALAAGVRMALGSDIRPLREGALLESGLWVRHGATPRQAVLACTRHAAELCGAGDSLGTIEPGKLADMIVVRGNPLEDIHSLRRLQMVIRGGAVVSRHVVPLT